MEYKISVIIPIYNVRNKIYKCIESLKKQIFKEFEVLFIDDGSKDDSIYLARDYLKYTDINFRIIKKNKGGVSSARNVGIDHSRGEYLCFLDTDYYIDELFLKNIYSYAKETESDVVYCGYIYEDSDGNKISSNLQNLKKSEYTGEEAALGLIYGYSQTVIASNLFSRELIINNNIRFDETRKYEEDTSFQIKAYVNASKVSYLKNLKTHYIQWDDSKKNRITKSYLDVYYSNVDTLEYLKENFNNKDFEKAMVEYRLPASIISIFVKFSGDNLLKPVLVNLRKDLTIKRYLKKMKIHRFENKRIRYYIMGKTMLYMPNVLESYCCKFKSRK